jgi:hypothetical protein
VSFRSDTASIAGFLSSSATSVVAMSGVASKRRSATERPICPPSSAAISGSTVEGSGCAGRMSSPNWLTPFSRRTETMVDASFSLLSISRPGTRFGPCTMALASISSGNSSAREEARSSTVVRRSARAFRSSAIGQNTPSSSVKPRNTTPAMTPQRPARGSMR